MASRAANPEPVRENINGWVENKTNGKIQDLFPPYSITSDTRLALANAIYFKASWMYPFPAADTADGEFTLLDGSCVRVPMMKQDGMPIGYAAGGGWRAVSLPYWCGVSMVILLPDAGRFRDFESLLDAVALEGVIGTLPSEYEVNLEMPKFRIETSVDLGDTLASMGMPLAFSNSADFSGMTTDEPLKIGIVVHKAYISVDEKGTEAAAATGIGMEVTGIEQPPPTVDVKIDHPFIFVIRDDVTGAVLFAGRVLNPAQT